MSHEAMKPDELREKMAEFLGGEMTPVEAARYEAALTTQPLIKAEVEGLKTAIVAMQRLDTAPPVVDAPVTMAKPARRHRGYAMRLAAMIGLAFFLGYIVKGLESPPPSAPQDDVVTEESLAEDSFGTQFVTNYVNDARHSGFGRSLIAYSKSMGIEKVSGRDR